MDDLGQLTPEENAKLREFLRERDQADAPMKFVEQLPIAGPPIAQIGRYSVYSRVVKCVVWFVLVPATIHDAYNFWRPASSFVYTQVCDLLGPVSDDTDIGNLPATQDYIVLDRTPDTISDDTPPYDSRLHPVTGIPPDRWGSLKSILALSPPPPPPMPPQGPYPTGLA